STTTPTTTAAKSPSLAGNEQSGPRVELSTVVPLRRDHTETRDETPRQQRDDRDSRSRRFSAGSRRKSRTDSGTVPSTGDSWPRCVLRQSGSRSVAGCTARTRQSFPRATPWRGQPSLTPQATGEGAVTTADGSADRRLPSDR